MIEGFLRRSIAVIEGTDKVSLYHPYWQLDLPKPWASTTPGIAPFLARKITSHEARQLSAKSADLLLLLEAQGCLTFRSDVDSYSYPEARALFRALANEWYGEYYRHEIWDALRTGSLPRNALLNWLIHNYQISRSAGITAARCATRSPRRSIRKLFFHSALEEYAHCEQLHFVRHPTFNVSDDYIKSYIHLPYSLAFDQLMLRTAETDWLGHVFISLFQEYTGNFYQGAKVFFDAVEQQYGLCAFFAGWKAHIEFDLDHQHSNSFSKVLDGTGWVSITQLTHSLTSAWFAYRALFRALDQIQSHSNQDVDLLRLSVSDGYIDRRRNALVSRYSRVTDRFELPSSCTFNQLLETLYQGGFVPRSTVEGCCDPDPKDLEFIRVDLADSVFRCLSYVEAHDDVIALGKIAEGVFDQTDVSERAHLIDSSQPATCEAMAVANFLRELSTRPIDFCYILSLALTVAYSDSCRRTATWIPLPREASIDLRGVLHRHEARAQEVWRLATRHLQFIELLDLWLNGECKTAPNNFFTG